MSDVFYVNHSSIVVPNYEIGTSEKLERSLSVWDKARYTIDPVGMYYNEETETLYLPRGIDIGFVERELDRRPHTNRNHDEYTSSYIRLRDEPRDDLQKKSISFLVGAGTEFGYTKSASQLALTLSTGAGKTFCTVAALSVFKKTPIIITHNNNIKSQWVDAFTSHTDVDERSICDIKGSAVIRSLMSKSRLPHKVYLVNRRTLNSYAKQNGWDAIGDLFRKLGIGVKVYDEAHLEFNSILMTDFHTNTWKSIYLTANLERSDRDENRVYELCFKNVYEYGSISSMVLKKHMVYFPVRYDSKPAYGDKAGMKTIRGLSIPNYTRYMMSNEEFFGVLEDLLPKVIPIVRKSKTKGKVVCMSATIESTNIMRDFIHKLFPDLDVRSYNSSLSEKEKQDVLDTADVITTTSRSLGTGSNIENVQLLINTEPYSSKVTANQVSGRLRPLSSGEKTMYVEIIDTGFPETENMYKRRRSTLVKKALKVAKLDYL